MTEWAEIMRKIPGARRKRGAEEYGVGGTITGKGTCRYREGGKPVKDGKEATDAQKEERRNHGYMLRWR